MFTLCRTCGQVADHARTLFDKKDTDILYNILKLTGIWLTDKPGVPMRICVSCRLDLKRAIAFRERCIRTNHFWFGERDDHDELNAAGKETKQPDCKKDDDLPSKPTYPLATHELLDPLMSEETLKVENESEHSDIESEDSSSQQLDGDSSPSLSATHKKRGRPPKMRSESSVETPPKEQSEKETTRRKWARAKRIHAKEEGLYFCEQCGKSFSEKGNFNVHLTRHTGLKQFECEECGRKEFTLHLLKLHVRIKHRGELPYVCKYCGQRFDNCIKRLRHERGHKESPVLRPHTCAICKKAFKDKITLRFHAVVHTGEQPFHCELCQTHFNRKSSLRTHFRSKLHIKRAEEQKDQVPGNQEEAVRADE